MNSDHINFFFLATSFFFSLKAAFLVFIFESAFWWCEDTIQRLVAYGRTLKSSSEKSKNHNQYHYICLQKFHLRISTHCQRILEGTNSFTKWAMTLKILVVFIKQNYQPWIAVYFAILKVYKLQIKKSKNVRLM